MTTIDVSLHHNVDQTPTITGSHGVLANGILNMADRKSLLLLLQYKGNGHMN